MEGTVYPSIFSRNDKRLSLILLPLAYTINAPTRAKIA